MVKCLSLKQPYAELLVSGKKKIEIRTWNTRFRGEFFIHASRTINKDASKRKHIDCSSLVKGAVIGKATLYDVKEYKTRTDFTRDRNKHLAELSFSRPLYGFLVKNMKRFDRPIFMPGKLKFFEVEFT